MTIMSNAIQIVTDMFGSRIMSRQITPPTNTTGSIPLNVVILSSRDPIYAAANTINPNLEISLACIVKNGRFIHRRAP